MDGSQCAVALDGSAPFFGFMIAAAASGLPSAPAASLSSTLMVTGVALWTRRHPSRLFIPALGRCRLA